MLRNRFFTIPVLIYLVIFFSITLIQGHLFNGSKIMFATPDADESRIISDFLFSGSAEIEDYMFGLRGIIFPVYVSIYKITGYTGYFFIQILLNILTLFFVFKSIKQVTGSDRYALSAMIIIMSAPTFSFIVFVALSETLVFLLVSMSLYFGIKYYFTGRKNIYLFLSFLSASFLISVKGIFLLPFIIFLIYLLYNLLRSNRKLLNLLYILAGITPFVLQLVIISRISINESGFSGNFNFNYRYFPAVYNFEQTGAFRFDSLTIAESNSRYPGFTDKVQFLIDNIPSTITMSVMIIGNNLIKGSNFTNFPSDVVRYHFIGDVLHLLSRIEIILFTISHLVFLILLISLLRKKQKIPELKFFIFLTTIIFSLILSSVLTFWQGDRLVIIGLPIWLVNYSGILYYYIQTRKKILPKLED